MGTLWNTYRQSKSEFVSELLSKFSPGQVIKSSVRGNRLWVLVKRSSQTTIIGLFLMYCEDGCWGYKDMSEADGPFFYDCPLSFLDAAPEPDGFNLNHGDSGKTWRAFVRSYHEGVRNRTRLNVGDTITLDATLYPNHQGPYKVTENLGRKGYLLNGYIRLKCNQVRHTSIVV